MSKGGRVLKKGSALAALLFVGLFAWMLTRPFENFFGNPENGGPLEVHFGTPLSRTIYGFWPESGTEQLITSTGMWDRFKMEFFYLLSQGTIDLGDYEIRGQEITGRVLQREFLNEREIEETIIERGVLVGVLPAKAKIALEEGRKKIRKHWPEKFPGPVSISSVR